VVFGISTAFNSTASPIANKKSATTKLNGKIQVTPTGLKYLVFKKGKGASPITGKPVTVHYTGWLLKGYDSNGMPIKGRMFDSSRRRRRTFSFKIGVGRVIKGWDQGVGAMKVGGRRLLIIPAKLGYGQRGAGRVIPPGATLLFDVELISVP
jgi:peptidylprolyl isomerase